MRLSQQLTLVAVCGVAIVVGLSYLSGGDSAAVERQDAYTDSLVGQLLVAKHVTDARLESQRRLDSTAEQHSRAVRPIHDTLIVVQQAIVVSADTVDTASAGDTTEYMRVIRKNDPLPYRVPKFLLDDRAFLIKSAFSLDSAWRSERMARINADAAIADLQRQYYVAEDIVRSQRAAIELRDREKRRSVVRAGVLSVAAWEVGKVLLRALRR